MISISFDGNKCTCYYNYRSCSCSFVLIYHPKSRICTFHDYSSIGMTCKSCARVLNRCMKCFNVYYGI